MSNEVTWKSVYNRLMEPTVNEYVAERELATLLGWNHHENVPFMNFNGSTEGTSIWVPPHWKGTPKEYLDEFLDPYAESYPSFFHNLNNCFDLLERYEIGWQMCSEFNGVTCWKDGKRSSAFGRNISYGILTAFVDLMDQIHDNS